MLGNPKFTGVQSWIKAKNSSQKLADRRLTVVVTFEAKVLFDCWLIISQLINSSNWPWFCVEVLSKGSHRKYTKGNGQLLVAGKRLTLGVRGPGEKPSWGET